MHYDNQTLETKNLCCSQTSRRLGCLIIVLTLLTSSCGVVFFASAPFGLTRSALLRTETLALLGEWHYSVGRRPVFAPLASTAFGWLTDGWNKWPLVGEVYQHTSTEWRRGPTWRRRGWEHRCSEGVGTMIPWNPDPKKASRRHGRHGAIKIGSNARLRPHGWGFIRYHWGKRSAVGISLKFEHHRVKKNETKFWRIHKKNLRIRSREKSTLTEKHPEFLKSFWLAFEYVYSRVWRLRSCWYRLLAFVMLRFTEGIIEIDIVWNQKNADSENSFSTPQLAYHRCAMRATVTSATLERYRFDHRHHRQIHYQHKNCCAFYSFMSEAAQQIQPRLWLASLRCIGTPAVTRRAAARRWLVLVPVVPQKIKNIRRRISVISSRMIIMYLVR